VREGAADLFTSPTSNLRTLGIPVSPRTSYRLLSEETPGHTLGSPLHPSAPRFPLGSQARPGRAPLPGAQGRLPERGVRQRIPGSRGPSEVTQGRPRRSARTQVATDRIRRVPNGSDRLFPPESQPFSLGTAPHVRNPSLGKWKRCGWPQLTGGFATLGSLMEAETAPSQAGEGAGRTANVRILKA